MIEIKDVDHVLVDRDESGASLLNQVNVRKLGSGELVAVYDEERFPFHHDTGETILVRSTDGGCTWGGRQVVLRRYKA